VVAGECEKGILCCGTGIGISIAANKVKGIRCVVCSDCYSAMLSAQHNNTNMLAMGSRVVGSDLAKLIVKMWLSAGYEGGRHQKRIDQIKSIEETGEIGVENQDVVTGDLRVDSLLKALTIDEKIQMVHGARGDIFRANQAGFVKGVERLNIPNMFIADGESGINTSWDATVLPSKVGLAATFDTKTCREYGETLGREAKALGMHVLLSPRVNIARDPVADINGSNGGNYQTYGEDPVLNGKLGAAEVEGIQRDNNAIANAKQMLGSSTGTAQGAGNCIIDEQSLHEIYMRPFEDVVKAGVGSAMTNYNQVNGVWSYKFTDMNNAMLRERWSFEGFILDDWHCLFEPEAIINNVDLEMPGIDYYGGGSENSVYGNALKDAIADPCSPVSEKDLNMAVSRILLTMSRFGMLDTPRIPGPLDVNNKELSIKAAKDIALKTAVLLKNDGILPLNIDREKLVVIGPTGRQTAMPVFKESSYGFSDRKTGPLGALQSHTDREIAFAVGDDLEGEIIPSKNLRPSADENVGGLRRSVTTLMPCEYPALKTAGLPAPECGGTVIDRVVNFTDENPLPVLKAENGNRPYYMWSGSLIADETGYYRISVQYYTPGVGEFEKNIKTNRDMEISTSGDLYFKAGGSDCYEKIGIGYRVEMNGGAAPNSSVIPCMDGFNNVGGYVYMEKGKEYGIYLTTYNMYGTPAKVRLCWVTPSMAENNIKAAADAAKQADKAVVFAWHKSPSRSLELSENQNRLIEAVAAANPNTVVVLNNGDPVAMPWRDKVKGILEMWFPGQEGGYATADILLGLANPGGKLPVTFPKTLEDTPCHAPGHPERYAAQGRVPGKDSVQENVAYFTEGLGIGYRWYDENAIEPQFEFGYGLSYTTFEYSDLSLCRTIDSGLTAEFRVKNIGKMSGAEIAQCYICRPGQLPAGVKASPKTLGAFARVELEPGEEKTVKLRVGRESLCYWKVINENGRLDYGEGWELLIGDREVWIGASSRDIRLKGSIVVKE